MLLSASITSQNQLNKPLLASRPATIMEEDARDAMRALVHSAGRHPLRALASIFPTGSAIERRAGGRASGRRQRARPLREFCRCCRSRLTAGIARHVGLRQTDTGLRSLTAAGDSF